MAQITVSSGSMSRPVYTVTPDAQTSTASTVVTSGSEIDARPWTSVCYTVVCATNAIKWSVWGANASDYSDETAVLTATTVASGASGTYAAAQATYGYYRTKVIDDSGGTHGVATIRGIAKT